MPNDPRRRLVALLKHPHLGAGLRIALGLIVGLAFTAVLLDNIDFGHVGEILAAASLWPIVFALIAYAADFLLRAIRFWLMLREVSHHPIPLAPSISPFIASFGISDVLPLRAGDGFRVIWFNRQFGTPIGTLIGAMLVERILDLVSILILGGIALSLASGHAPPILVANFQLILMVAILAGLGVLFAPALLVRILERVKLPFAAGPIEALTAALRTTAETVERMGSWRQLLLLTCLSLACWILECMVFIGAWLSLNGDPAAFEKPFLSFAFATLGTLVPSLPGHFGSFEYFGVEAFTLAGVEASFAAAVVLLAHLILWAPTAIYGILWLLIGAQGKRAPAPRP
ncbi:MAG: flippase-like domain-containing protein [Alphaproteobacteria bacterium]|nr:flippase-like domain-containing protein [Alphaproteobacteria bacterium]